MIIPIAARNFKSGVTLDLNYTESYIFPIFLKQPQNFVLHALLNCV